MNSVIAEGATSGKAQRTPSRYRKVEVRTWGDEKFRALSPIPPCGQGLWLFLITGPHTCPIPGLFRAGRAAMAEELGWDVEAFDEAFREAFRQGMVKADFKARVVWVPKAINHNRPESPNVVTSWAAEFDLIPECDLKREAFDALKASIHALGEAFGKAFDKAFGKPSEKAMPKTMPNQDQEQEQEQEQEKNKPIPPPLRVVPAAVAAEKEKATATLKAKDLMADGVVERNAVDWLAIRRAKKAPLTVTAWDAVKREATLAGMTPAQAVKHAAENNWQGFKASWVQRDAATASASPASIFDGVKF